MIALRTGWYIPVSPTRIAPTQMMTMTGVSYFSAMLLLAEIGDISRFHSGDQLVSYAGLAPSTHSSGGITHHGRITKGGVKVAAVGDGGGGYCSLQV